MDQFAFRVRAPTRDFSSVEVSPEGFRFLNVDELDANAIVVVAHNANTVLAEQQLGPERGSRGCGDGSTRERDVDDPDVDDDALGELQGREFVADWDALVATASRSTTHGG